MDILPSEPPFTEESIVKANKITIMLQMEDTKNCMTKAGGVDAKKALVELWTNEMGLALIMIEINEK